MIASRVLIFMYAKKNENIIAQRKATLILTQSSNLCMDFIHWDTYGPAYTLLKRKEHTH